MSQDSGFGMKSQQAWDSFAASRPSSGPAGRVRLSVSLKDVCLVIAFLLFVTAGFKMTGIESISGDSINEAFYQAFGVFSFALGFVTLAYGLQGNR